MANKLTCTLSNFVMAELISRFFTVSEADFEGLVDDKDEHEVSSKPLTVFDGKESKRTSN